MKLPDLETFKNRLSGKTRDELLIMRRNAENAGRQDCVAEAKSELNTRFPGWKKPSRRRGPTPTKVMFKGEEHIFDTAKEAYIWLIEHFIQAYPKPFKEIDLKTYFIIKTDREIKKRLYFARTRDALFYGSDNKENLAGDDNNSVRLSNGWWANLNLSNKVKLDILRKFAAVADLKMKKDWYWHVLDEAPPKSDEELLDEILGGGDGHAI